MEEFNVDAFKKFDKQWALVTAGSPDHFNTMTVSWGGLGTLWSKPVATVYIKPVRYTHEFMEANDYFTVSFYPEAYRKALALLGTLSGRDTDKVAQSKLTPVALKYGMTFKEAELTLVCRKIYRQDLDQKAMEAEVIKAYYSEEAPHTMYIGEVVEMIED